MQAVIAALAGVQVQSPGDWETPSVKLPLVMLRNRVERKVSNARTVPNFTTTVSLELLARIEGTTAEQAQDMIEDFGARLEDAVLGAPTFIAWLQQVSGITSNTNITSDGRRHIGELQMMIDCETFELYDPTEINPGNYPDLLQLLINIDTIRPFDPGASTAGAPNTVGAAVGDPLVGSVPATPANYPNPPFPGSVTGAPRESGPDGRNEGTLLINLGP